MLKNTIHKTSDLLLFYTPMIYSKNDENDLPYILMKHVSPDSLYNEMFYKNLVISGHGTY